MVDPGLQKTRAWSALHDLRLPVMNGWSHGSKIWGFKLTDEILTSPDIPISQYKITYLRHNHHPFTHYPSISHFNALIVCTYSFHTNICWCYFITAVALRCHVACTRSNFFKIKILFYEIAPGVGALHSVLTILIYERKKPVHSCTTVAFCDCLS